MGGERKLSAGQRAEGPDPLAPTPAEVAAEVAELGRIAFSLWLDGAGRVAEGGLLRPARTLGAVLGAVATPTGTLINDAVRPAGSAIEGAIRPAAEAPPGAAGAGSRSSLRGSLRERGAELLRRSADVRFEQDQHPAYRRILDELAPDEARILRLLATEGTQPVVDVKAGLPPASRTVSDRLSMIGADAGCRFPERGHAYIDNLSRLGLALLANEAVSDPTRYQLLEAQPDVVAALGAAGRTARTVRRGLRLTTFGADFCAECMPT